MKRRDELGKRRQTLAEAEPHELGGCRQERHPRDRLPAKERSDDEQRQHGCSERAHGIEGDVAGEDRDAERRVGDTEELVLPLSRLDRRDEREVGAEDEPAEAPAFERAERQARRLA